MKKKLRNHKPCAQCKSLTTRTQSLSGAIFPLCHKCPPVKLMSEERLVYQMELSHRSVPPVVLRASIPDKETSFAGQQQLWNESTTEQLCLF